jgi:hypothetical protein
VPNAWQSLVELIHDFVPKGFALTEAIALFALMMAFLISFVFQSEPDASLKESALPYL